MVAVGEILLNAVFDVLFDRLASRDFLNFVRQLGGGVDSELKKWERKLKMIQAVLADAEEKQLTDEAVKMWLDDLQDLAYDAEDILDEFAAQVLEHKLTAQQDQDSTGHVLSFISANLNPNAIVLNYTVGSKIKDITSRLEQLGQERIELGLQRIPGGISSTAVHVQRRPPSSSVPTERAVYGRENDKAKILELVLTETSNDAIFVVIPIVGMGGIGKTTLAREVYNDKAVEDSKFDVKAWVCVSDVFDVFSISKALLESITRKPCDLNTLNEVQVELKGAVNGKRFLLVLDDVWNENYNLWVDLKAPFLAAAPDSKMIVTTRHSHVASTMGPIDHYNLNHLLDDDCWSIFIEHAFDGRDLNSHQVSELFRKEVVGKCGGLPLAAITLGGLLRTTRCDVWEDLLDSKIWDLPQQSGILPVLRLSYHHLPSHLKRCFSYCSIFPKDYQFSEKELVLLWMAGGIIRQSRNNEQLEDWGSRCFQDLVSRSIFQQYSCNSSKFVMHDLVHDLSQLVSRETIFRLEEANTLSRRFERVRHFSYVRDEFDGKNKFELFYEIKHLRTFLPVNLRSGTRYGHLTSMVLYDLLPKFKKLRTLSLEGYEIYELPISLGDLRLLRYLNLAYSKIRSLPESTDSLLNLEILILRHCSRLTKLPSKMKNLINLHYLDIKGANLLKGMPYGMKDLKNLQTLSKFVVGKGESVSGLEDLKNLKFLSSELCIVGLENVKDPQSAREATLCEKQNVEALSLEWASQFDNSRGEVAEEHVLEGLQPHKCLKELTIKNYSGARFPRWIGDPLFFKMEALKLQNCENCICLPSLGLLSSLKLLSVKGLKKLKSIGSEVYGDGFSMPFQSLEILHFQNLPEWVKWNTNIKGNEHAELFPCLRELSILKCPELSEKLPELLPSLETLVVDKCQKLVVSSSSYPKLRRLEIDECKELVCRTPVDSKLINSMTISNSSLNITGLEGMLYDSPTGSSLLKKVTISNFLEFGKIFNEGFQMLENLAIGNSEQMKSRILRKVNPFEKKPGQGLTMRANHEELSIEENCTRLVSFPELNFCLNNLRSFWIEKSAALKSLPDEMMGNNSQLERLIIRDCDSLTFIARRKLPLALKTLEIDNCKKLQHLVEGEEGASSSSSTALKSLTEKMMGNNSQLESLFISDCDSLTSIARRKLPSSLKTLEILNCKNLQHLVEGEEDASSSSSTAFSSVTLKHLRIWSCPELKTLSSRINLLEALEDLVVAECPKLKSIPDGLQNLNFLQRISVWSCPSLESFAERGLPNTILNIYICSCEKLEALPKDMHKLNSLQFLSIRECPSIVSFPEEGLPTNITELQIGDVKMYKAVIQWGLHRLTSLRILRIEGCDEEECFPDEETGIILPTSLIHLYLRGLSKLKCLSSTGFRSLASLESLLIGDCPNLTSFPESGLPSSVLKLYILKCPKLKQESRRDKGKEWPKIAHIPLVAIDNKYMYDTEE